MKWILYILLTLAGLATIYLWYLKYPGYIEIVWLHYEIKSTVIVFLILLIIFLFFIFVAFRILSWIVRIPSRWTNSFRLSQDSKVNHQLLSLYTYHEAEMNLKILEFQKKAPLKLSIDPLFLWISGNAFDKSDKSIEAEQCFMELMKNPTTCFLGLKGEIRSALRRSDFNGAFTHLERAEKLLPTSPWVLKHLLSLNRENKNYKNAEELILRLKELGQFTLDQSRRQIGHLKYQQAVDPKTPTAEKEDLLKQAHHLDPSHVETTIAFAKLLCERGSINPALSAIQATWILSPEADLADLYLNISNPQNDLEAYKLATQLVQNTDKSSVSLLFLARKALNAKLWEEARVHLTKLAKQDPSAKVNALFAKLELEENKNIHEALKYLAK